MKLSILLLLALSAFAPKDELLVTSPSFQNNAGIPPDFTCEGKNINPVLTIQGTPANTKSYAIIMDDPDAAKGTFDHWVVFNVKPVEMIPENFTGGIFGRNSEGKLEYKGPCPPSGTHHYHIKVYAVDMMLGLKEGASKQEVENAITGHILAQGELVGLYKKIKK